MAMEFFAIPGGNPGFAISLLRRQNRIGLPQNCIGTAIPCLGSGDRRGYDFRDSAKIYLPGWSAVLSNRIATP